MSKARRVSVSLVRGRLAASALAATAGLTISTLAVVQTSRAAFTASTSTAGSNVSAGSVALASDAAASVPFDISNMKPGDTASRCVNVTYGGSLTADVRMYGVVTGSGLAPYLDTMIDVGSGAAGGAAMSCDGFATSSNLHAGTLAAFGAARSNYANGLTGFASAATGALKSYRVTISLRDDNSAQGKGAGIVFTWEAQNI